MDATNALESTPREEARDDAVTVETGRPVAPGEDDVEDVTDVEEDVDDSICCCTRCCSLCLPSCCMRWPQRWPRSFGILFGVCLPLFSLIAISVFLGYFLAYLEAPEEVASNNAIISTNEIVTIQKSLVDEITEQLPLICSSLFLLEKSGQLSYEACLENNITSVNCTEPSLQLFIESAIQRVFVNKLSDCTSLGKINMTKDQTGLDINFTESFEQFSSTTFNIEGSELLTYMTKCGYETLSVIGDYEFQDIVKPELISAEPTFNWIRCESPEKKKKGISGKINEGFTGLFNATNRLPTLQEQAVEEQWKKNQQELYCNYLEDNIKQNQTLLDARLDALSRSMQDASGFDESLCSVNYYAGAWFWFTVMTTVGYGNTAPTSVGARAMVFTLGFFSIVLFAGVLAKSGRIVVAILDDIAQRSHLSRINKPWFGVLFYGLLYYLWMIFIASYYQYWNNERLEEDIHYEDAYWFAYISTTTVGLGDFYLEHAVLVGHDLIVWPLLFLFGFVLLSSFLNKVADYLYSFMPEDRLSFEERLANENIPLCSWLRPWFKKEKKKTSGHTNNGQEDNEKEEASHNEEDNNVEMAVAAQDEPDNLKA